MVRQKLQTAPQLSSLRRSALALSLTYLIGPSASFSTHSFSIRSCHNSAFRSRGGSEPALGARRLGFAFSFPDFALNKRKETRLFSQQPSGASKESVGDFQSMSEGSGPVTSLLKTIKSACDEMSPMVRALYQAVSADKADTKSTKEDNSAFTIADGVVQHLLVNYLFGKSKFRAVVGEEDSSVVNIESRPYSVDNLQIPPDLFDMIDGMKTRITEMAVQIDSNSYKDRSIFIDPIDGTREFTIGQGEQCTILVGISDAAGRAEGGVVHRPIPEPPEWVIGCAAEDCRMHNLPLVEAAFDPPKLATTQTKLTPYTEALLQAGMDRFPIGGAGNKILVLMEGKASAFVTDKVLNRWDTCSPEAVLDAYGGMLVKLSSVLQDPEAFERGEIPASAKYTYLQSERNLDLADGEDGEGVKPYTNLCGSFVLPQRKDVAKFVQAAVTAAKECAPTYRK